MPVGNNFVNEAAMAQKAQMVGMPNKAHAVTNVREAKEPPRIQETRESEETAENDPKRVNTTAPSNRVDARRRISQDNGSSRRLERGSADWTEADRRDWRDLPPSLRPLSKSAGDSHAWNVPYWLLTDGNKQQEESAVGCHYRLLNGLKTMVHNDIQQYVKGNNPYPKKTLREIYNVLGDEKPSHSPGLEERNLTGAPSGLTHSNWTRAQSTIDALENPPPDPGIDLNLVA